MQDQTDPLRKRQDVADLIEAIKECNLDDNANDLLIVDLLERCYPTYRGNTVVVQNG